MGYGHIAAGHAPEIDEFYREHFNGYLNFHRPCGQAERRVDGKGKEKFVYKVYRTPWEVLRGLEAVREGESYLKEGLSVRSWIEWRERKAATTRGSGCKRPNGSYFWAFRRNGKRHETGGTRRKCVGEVTGMVSRGRCASRRSAPGAPGVWEQEPKGQGKLQNLYEGKNHSSGGGSVSRLPLVGPESCWENGRLRSTQSTQIRRPGGGSTRSLLQAHPSIRKC